MASLFCRLITTGQHRQVELQTLFNYELCTVPASTIAEYGCVKRGTKSTLVSKTESGLSSARCSRHGYRRWPTTAISHCLAMCWVCFRSRQQHEGHTRSVTTNISAGHLRSLWWQVSKRANPACRWRGCWLHYHIKQAPRQIRKLSSEFSPLSILATTWQWLEESIYSHGEADIIIITSSYLLEAVKNGKNTVWMISDDTDVFVLLSSGCGDCRWQPVCS